MRSFGLKRCFSMCTRSSRISAHPAADLEAPSSSPLPPLPAQNQDHDKMHIRLVPHVSHDTPCHVFPVMERELANGSVLKLGRYNDARAGGQHLSFKSRVVSRNHAKLWSDNGKLFIHDTGSSSGTFVNHMRLRDTAQQLQDGDLVQLGMDFEEGHESMYRAVRIRLTVRCIQEETLATTLSPTAHKQFQAAFGGQECCICLEELQPTQALFVSPCFHVYHYDCLRPLLDRHFPAFACPLCRSYADLGARPTSTATSATSCSSSSAFSYSGEPLQRPRSSLYQHEAPASPPPLRRRPPPLLKRVSGSLRSIIT